MLQKRRGGGASVERWLPLLYFVAALALVVAVLPSVLRQLPPEQSQTSELSPDAPADPDAPALVSSFSRPSTATAGTPTDADVPGTSDTVGSVAAQPAKSAPRGVCFGNPPRQTFSVYSPPCAPAFTGDNGGATAPGVTATEIRIAYMQAAGRPQAAEGEVLPTPKPNDNNGDRALRAYLAWFNTHYELSGRRIRLFSVSRPGQQSGEEAMRAKARLARDSFGAFAVIGHETSFLDEAARLGMVAMGGMHVEASFLADRQPHTWAWLVDGTRLARMNAEFSCKSLAGRPARWAGNVAYQTRPRRFGVVVYSDPSVSDGGMAETYAEELRSGCGERVHETVTYNVTGAEGASNLATGIAKLKSQDITTVLWFGDAASLSAFTATADSQDYNPEWQVTGATYIPQNNKGRSMSPAQWQHAFGLSMFERWRPAHERDYYKAYKEVDPSGTPYDEAGEFAFYPMEQLLNGIQSAGPRLTATTLQTGLYSIGHRVGDPTWAIGGGYSPGDRSYVDDAALVWWNPTATAEDDDLPGRYEFIDGGRRYGPGQFPEGEPAFFESGGT